MTHMSLSDHHEMVGGVEVKVTTIASWECRECGTKLDREASVTETMLSVCDFCSSPVGSGAVNIPCRDFTILMVGLGPNGASTTQPWGSKGAWSACPACAILVNANDQPGLTLRALGKLLPVQTTPADREAMLESLTQMHRAFFRHRIV